MLGKKLFRFFNGFALFAMVFMSLAPSVSHALTTQNSQNSFKQEICNSTGDKIVIQVVTTLGKQMVTELTTQKSSSKTINMHIKHCPFCLNANVATGLPGFNTQIIAVLEATAQKIEQNNTPIINSRTYNSPPSQAPPSKL